MSSPHFRLLVSDGRNTCETAPPCEVAKDLKKQNPGLTISVVSLRTDQDDVRCVADVTGGYYTTADTGRQLQVRAKAALDEVHARLMLSPSGVAGIAVGASHAGIRSEVPDFPGLETGTLRDWNGEKVTVVVWLDCEWFFKDQSLVAISTVENGAGHTVDGVAVGQPISQAEEILGQPITEITEGDSRVRVYPANQTGLHWRVLTDLENLIRQVVLCRCGTTSDALVLSFEGLGPWKVVGQDLVDISEFESVPDGCFSYWSPPGYQGKGIVFQPIGFSQDEVADDFEIWVGPPDDPAEESPVVTYAGARIGMTLGEIKKLHPDLRIETKTDNYGHTDFPVIRSGEREMMFFIEGYFGPDISADRTPKDSSIVTHIRLRDWKADGTGGC